MRCRSLIIGIHLAFCALIRLTPAHAAQDVSSRKPNILLIMADQWRADAFGYAGNRDVQTPAFDQFARESVRFTNAVASIPVCTPSRAALLTGRRGLSTGMFMNDVPLRPTQVTLPDVLSEEGYATAFIGKWHVDGHGRSSFIPVDRRHHFSYWRGLECTHDYNNSFYYGDAPIKRTWKGYDAEAQTQRAIKYMRHQARHGKKPFFVMLSWGPPHEPYQTAPPRYRKMYDPRTITLRPNVPPDHRALAQTQLAGYYAHCTALDDCLSRLRLFLKEQDLERNTLVVFTSDHGDMIESHGNQKKQQPWDESCCVPMLFRLPGQSLGKTLAAPLVTEDIMPTILRLCGIQPPARLNGCDFSQYMVGGKDPTDGAALVLCPAPFGQWQRKLGGKEYRAIRTTQYTYARDLMGPWLLYDNQADPYQMNNLVDRPEYAALQKKMDDWLQKKLKQTRDRFEPAAAYIRRYRYDVDATGTVNYSQ